MNGYPPTFLEGKSEAIIVHDETILTWDSNRWDRLTASKYAIGSGRCIALGALEAGATAEQSVAAAIIRDTGSGGPVRAIRVR